MMLLAFACIIAATALEAGGQLCFKKVANHPTQLHPLALLQFGWRHKVTLLIAALCFLCELGLWTIALFLLPVSKAYPVGSLGFVFVTFLSRLWLHERVGLNRWLGVALILCGILLISLP